MTLAFYNDKLQSIRPDKSSGRAKSHNILISGDMFSLGVLMHQLVTGRPPYPKPSELNKTVSRKLEEFIFKALSVNSSDRWGSIDDMLADLKVVRIAQTNFEPAVTLSAHSSEPGDLEYKMAIEQGIWKIGSTPKKAFTSSY